MTELENLAHKAEVAPEQETFGEMFRQATYLDVQPRTISGSAFTLFQDVAEHSADKLAKISPELPFDILYPENYQANGSASILRELNRQLPGVALEVRELADDRRSLLKEAARDLAGFYDQVPDIEFSDSSYVRMNGITSCTFASFLMLFKGITGASLEFDVAHDAIKESDPETIIGQVPDSVLTNMFNTPAFAACYPNLNCQTIRFVGFTPENLSALLCKARERWPDSEIRAALSVASESANGGVLHCVVPKSINQREVVGHDPASYGGADVVFDTSSFLRRWYEAQGYGYLIISNFCHT